MERWKQAGWMNAKGKPVANREEWQELAALLKDKPHTVMLDE